MKILKTIVIFLFLSIFANANEDDKKNIKILTDLYEKVVLKDVNKLQKDIKSLKALIEKKDAKNSKKEFSSLVKSWKAVETFYILGDLNEDYIDTPRYIDIYHNGNEDIKEQLNRAIKSEDEVRIALFKNSTKSINALEYILFTKDINKDRVQEIAITILKRISMHVQDIKDEYLAQKSNFTKDLKKANAIVINAIIQNSYKLKEWRLGDVIGLSQKYQGKPDNRRAEYYISQNSANAIEAVLNTYKEVLNNDSFEDFGDYLVNLTDGKQMKQLREALDKSLVLVKDIKNDDFSNTQELFDLVNQIHVILFVEMIEDLSINAKILDADGD